MSLSKKDLIIFFLISLLFYFHFRKKENFSDLGLRKLPDGSIVINKNLYVGGTTNMKNLYVSSNIKGKTGELLIEGNLKVNGNVGIRTDPYPRVGLVVNGGLETMRGGVYVDGEIKGRKITKL